MYKVDIKNIKAQKSTNFIFILAGIFFLIIICILLIRNQNPYDSKTASTKLNIVIPNNYDGKYKELEYSFYVNDKEYLCKDVFLYEEIPDVNNKTVYYNSKDPSICTLNENDINESDTYILIGFSLIPILSIVMAFTLNINVYRRIRTVKKLSKYGKLIKSIPYHMEYSNVIINGHRLKWPVINYTLPSEYTLTLHGDPRYEKTEIKETGFADLLIDEKNPEIYFIDFEINRINGNLPEDFYQNNREK